MKGLNLISKISRAYSQTLTLESFNKKKVGHKRLIKIRNNEAQTKRMVSTLIFGFFIFLSCRGGWRRGAYNII